MKEHLKSVFNKDSSIRAMIEVPEYHKQRKEYRQDGKDIDYHLRDYTERYVLDEDNAMTMHQVHIELPFEGNFIGDRYGASAMNLSKIAEHELTKKVYAAYNKESEYDRTLATKTADFFDMLDRLSSLVLDHNYY